MWQALVRSRTRRNLVAVGLALVIWAGLAAVYLAESGTKLQPLHALDVRLLDLRLSLRQAPEVPDEVVVVAVDRASTAAPGEGRWSGVRLAELLDRLRQAGAATVVFAFPLTETRGGAAATHLERVIASLDELGAADQAASGPALAQARQAATAALRELGDGETALVEAMTRSYAEDAALPVLALELEFGSTTEVLENAGPAPEVRRLLAERGTYQDRPGQAEALLQRPAVRAVAVAPPQARLADQAATLGFVNLQSPDRVFRSLPMVAVLRQLAQERGNDSGAVAHAVMPLAVAAVSTHLRLGVDELVLDATGGELRLEGTALARSVFRLGDGLQAVVDFYGPAGTIHSYSAVDVLEDRLTDADGEPLGLASVFAGKLVFVGVTDTRAAVVVRTPVDAAMPEVELHATMAGNLLQGRNLHLPVHADAAVLLTALAATLVAALVAANLGGAAAGVLVLALAATAAWWSVQQLAAEGMVWPWALPGTGLGLGWLAMALLNGTAAARSRRRLRETLGSNASDRVLRRVMHDPEQAQLAGERRLCTVMACSMMEAEHVHRRLARPQDVLAVTGRYLERMGAVVADEGGLVIASCGPGFQALFGAPVKDPEQAASACRTALRMQRALRRLNTVLEMEGHPELASGVGLASGAVVVGSMGTAARRAYTAMGEPTRLAERLQQLNRLFGTRILVCGVTRSSASSDDPELVFRAVDRLVLADGAAAVELYELVGVRRRLSRDELAALECFSEALELYRAARFDEAEVVFRQVLAADPGDGPALLYARRCAEQLAGAGRDQGSTGKAL